MACCKSTRGRALICRREAPVGKWCQGVAWNSKSDVVLVQCMVEQEILAFNFSGARLDKAGVVKTSGGPAAIRTAEK
jgi:hypothetical protein